MKKIFLVALIAIIGTATWVSSQPLQPSGSIYEEDTAGLTGDPLTGIACRRNDTPTSRVGTDGDYSAVACDEYGQLKTTSTFSFSGGTADATKLEDAAHSSGDRLEAIAGQIQATPSASAADGDYGTFKLDSKGVLWSRISVDSGMVGAEDNAITGGNYGFIILGQRQDTPANDSSNDGDAGYIKLDSRGLQYVNPWGANSTEWFRGCSASDVTGTTATEVIAATASKYKYITGINCTNTDATVNTRVEIQEDLSGTPAVLWSFNLAAVTGSDGMKFDPPLKTSAVNTNVGVDPITTSAEVRCCIEGFVSAN